MGKINNILFIQDDEASCLLNKAIVEQMQVAENIHCMDDDHKALEFLKKQCSDKTTGENACPDLVFVDINLPFLNAFEFLERLGNHPDIDADKFFIVLLTSTWDVRDKERAKNLKVNGYMHKPLTQDKVQELMQRAQRSQSSQKSIAPATLKEAS